MARASSKTLNKIVKDIPSSESGCGVVCYTGTNKSGEKYIISQNPTKMKFALWKCCEDGYEKISTSDNPLDFNDMIPFGKTQHK